jgi:hypothetical protein
VSVVIKIVSEMKRGRFAVPECNTNKNTQAIEGL